MRGEHANLQYRLDDVLLPEGIAGFGQELSTRIIDNISLITGALPAQFGFRTTGVIDIHTKNGAAFTGGEASLEVGSFDTIMPSFEYGGLAGKLTYYVTGSYLHNGIGIENPTSSYTPIHDNTDQYKEFAYLSYIIDDSSRLGLLLGGAEANFQIPNTPGLPPEFVVNGSTEFNSAKLNENQAENSSYGILTYQKKSDVFNLQASIFTRYSGVLFRPDNTGICSSTELLRGSIRQIITNGAELDMSYKSERAKYRARRLVLYRSRTRRSAPRPWCFRLMQQAIKPAMSRFGSSIIRARTAISSAPICRMSGNRSSN